MGEKLAAGGESLFQNRIVVGAARSGLIQVPLKMSREVGEECRGLESGVWRAATMSAPDVLFQVADA